ncbi:hypothetical protein LZZ85_25870 [Terrimonas sp. NA20]|uniref:DUF3592 domain-containing protein n=1 Tax=Terrimonas ginsenosidimutans TaxID=2908004 RepID=A0ABS9KZJ4_9BACT|nr:hypothetical protein [Terrimonas ginsenosidimutans]MCG2617756.1 hypothetical protein [Terrimonas ginsenosidimutans]
MTAFRFILLVLILYFGVTALKIEFSVLKIGLFDVFADLPFVILCLVTTAVIFLDAKYFAGNRKWYQLVSSMVGIVFTGIILKGKAERFATNNSPVVMRMHHIAGNDPVFSLELKKNGCFRLSEANMFGQSIYYGNYKRAGDSIHLFRYDHADVDKLPRIGFLRGDTVTWNDSIVMTIAEPRISPSP